MIDKFGPTSDQLETSDKKINQLIATNNQLGSTNVSLQLETSMFQKQLAFSQCELFQ